MKSFFLCLLLWLLILVAAHATNATEVGPAHFVLEETNINAIHHAIKKGDINCESLVNAYLTRIKQYNLSMNAKAPLNAIVEINPFLISAARMLDKQYAHTKTFVGPLHCIPIILKDNIDTYDGTSTSGSLALLGNQPTSDAALVTQIRKAGAIIIGRGTMDEFAAGLSGISSRSGRTGNSYDTTQNPGGSSGGPAVAVSANFAVLGIGTDNSGSVRIPAAFNGLVGLRPSMGLVSQNGILPRGNMDGTAGPIARTVDDLAALLDVIVVPTTPHPSSYLTCLNDQGLQGKRIGIVTKIGNRFTYQNMPVEVKNKIDDAVKLMSSQGAVMVGNIDLSQYDRNRKLNEAGELNDIDHYLASYPSTRQNFRDICMSNRTRTFGNVKACLDFIETLPKRSAIAKAKSIFAKNKKYVENIMNQLHLDALLIPVSTHGSASYDDDAFRNELLASNASLPGLTFNIGYTSSTPPSSSSSSAISSSSLSSMPIGIEFVGKQFAECTLIAMAYAYQQYVGARIPPILPDATDHLGNFDIAELNHLLTNIGYDAYRQVLQKNKNENVAKVLSADRFKLIVKKRLQAIANNATKL